MMPSNQFMFVDQVGVSNSLQQSPSIQQSFLQPEHYAPYQSHLLHQSLTKPVHNPSPPQPQYPAQYSSQSQLAVQSIMAPPSQSGISSQFFSQVGHQNQQQQHQFHAQQHQQFHYPQMNNMNGHNRMHPMQNGTNGTQSSPMNHNLLSSLLTSTNSPSQGQFRTNHPVSTQSQPCFSPNQFKQLPQMIRQPPSTGANNAIPREFRQIPDGFRQAPEHTPGSVIPSEFRQIPQPPRLVPSSTLQNEFRQVPVTKAVVPNEFQQVPVTKPIIPDEFRQAPIQTFGEQLEEANVVVSGLIENIQEMIENNDDPKLNSSDLNRSNGSALNDSVVEVSHPKNDSGDIDDLVHELLKDVEEMDNSFVADTSKDKTIELNDSIEACSSILLGSSSNIAEDTSTKSPPPNLDHSATSDVVASEANSMDCEESSLIHMSPIIASSPKPAIEEVSNLEHEDSPNEVVEQRHPEQMDQSPISVHDTSLDSPPGGSNSAVEEGHEPRINENQSTDVRSPSPVVEQSHKDSTEENHAFVNESINPETSINTEIAESRNPENEASTNPVTEASPNPVSEASLDIESPNPEIGTSPEPATETSTDIIMEDNEADVKPSFQFKIRKDIFFLDAVDFNTQKNLFEMETAEREALVASMNIPKELRDLSTPSPTRSPLLEEELKSGPENRTASFGNDQLDEIFRTQLSAPPQFGRQYGFPNLSLPSNIPPILGSILTQQQNSGRNVNFSSQLTQLAQTQQSAPNPFSITNPNMQFYLNQARPIQPRPGPIQSKPLQSQPIQRKQKPQMKADLLGNLSLTSPTPRKRQANMENKEPLLVDPTLPPGWSRSVSQRKTGASAGSWDTYIHHANGKRFRSRMEIKRYFEKIGETQLNWQDFDFNPFGSKGQQNPGQSSMLDGAVNSSILLNHISQDQSAEAENANTSSEMMEMEPDIHDFLSCELGTD
eukprot:TRINITY_DN18347_c0_g1_i1.p1 TRINITY_DN18347_c0_g1~~TRINITY_DN18347_c0_g1_i1.p1  ORF type:complete len:946 (-),score=186.65 TRINITY_DN18347_c0_g1_i1:541-3378(-)